MSYIRSLANGKYRAEISKNYTSIQSKTFSTQQQAESWADSIEKNIDKIHSINPIPSVALDELKKFRKIGNGLIFFSPNNSDKPFDFRKQWYATLKRANIFGFRFHDLRHTAASYLVMAGATLHEAGQILGHKSEQTTKRYAHLSTNHKAALAERVMSEVFNG